MEEMPFPESDTEIYISLLSFSSTGVDSKFSEELLVLVFSPFLIISKVFSWTLISIEPSEAENLTAFSRRLINI